MQAASFGYRHILLSHQSVKVIARAHPAPGVPPVCLAQPACASISHTGPAQHPWRALRKRADYTAQPPADCMTAQRCRRFPRDEGWDTVRWLAYLVPAAPLESSAVQVCVSSSHTAPAQHPRRALRRHADGTAPLPGGCRAASPAPAGAATARCPRCMPGGRSTVGALCAPMPATTHQVMPLYRSPNKCCSCKT